MKKKYNKNNVLIIGDTHLPYGLEGYLKHCQDMQKKYDCGTVIHIGDLVDFAGLSYHEKDPNMVGPDCEIKLAKELLKPWIKAFPELHLCMGNHDRLPARKAKSYGMPSRFIKSLADVLGTPKEWKWDFSFIMNDVLYYHGDSTITPATSIKKAISNGINTVHGHAHTNAGVYYAATNGRLIWAMNTGCGIDRHEKAFDYQKFVNAKPVIGCGVVLDKGKLPIFLPMDLGSKFKFKGVRKLK